MSGAAAKKLKAKLAKVRQKARPRDLVELYRELEDAEPREGTWPHRAAELYRKLGDVVAEKAALLRARERFEGAGFVLKAIAVCKRVLELDPDHAGARASLERLFAARGLPPEATGLPVPAPPAPPGAAAERASGAESHRRAAPEPSAPGAVSPPRAAPPACEASEEASADAAGSTRAPSEVAGTSEEWDALPELGLDPGAPLEELVLKELVDETRDLDEDEAGTMSEIVLTTPALGPAPPTEADGLTREALLYTVLFSSLPDAKLRMLVERSRLVFLDAGDVLFEEGDPGDALYVIADGAVNLVAGDPEKSLATLAQGQFFGEIALIADRPRCATARAAEDSILIRIDRALVAELVRDSRRVLQVLLRCLRDRLTRGLVRTSPLFDQLSVAEQEGLTAHFKLVEASPDSLLLEEGQPSNVLYAVLCGSVEVFHNDGRRLVTLARLEDGGVFGEISFLSGGPTIASVTTRSKCWLLALTRQDAGPFLQDPRIRARIESLAAARRAEHARKLDAFVL